MAIRDVENCTISDLAEKGAMQSDKFASHGRFGLEL